MKGNGTRLFSLEKGMDLNRERSVDWTKSFGTQTQHFSILLPPSILPLAFASAARVWPLLKTDFGGEERVLRRRLHHRCIWTVSNPFRVDSVAVDRLRTGSCLGAETADKTRLLRGGEGAFKV